MTLSSRSFEALNQSEIGRLEARKRIGQRRRSRSQYAGTITGYDADRGEAIVTLPTGGIAYAESITTSSSTRVGLSVPQLDTRGKIDARPPL